MAQPLSPMGHHGDLPSSYVDPTFFISWSRTLEPVTGKEATMYRTTKRKLVRRTKVATLLLAGVMVLGIGTLGATGLFHDTDHAGAATVHAAEFN